MQLDDIASNITHTSALYSVLAPMTPSDRAVLFSSVFCSFLFFLFYFAVGENHESSHNIHRNKTHTTGSALHSKLPK